MKHRFSPSVVVMALGFISSATVVSCRPVETPKVRGVVRRPAGWAPTSPTSSLDTSPIGLSDIYRRSHAVVIGIDEYTDMRKLTGAVRDASAMEKMLTEHGFDVIRLIDDEATRDRIMEVLTSELPKRVGPDDRVLIYFAGHGVSDGDGPQAMGYLMPVDADGTSPSIKGIDMDQLQRIFSRKYESKHLLYVADACYSGLAISTRSAVVPDDSPAYIRAVSEGRVRVSLTAGKSGEQANEWEGHGVFTLNLLSALRGAADGNADGYITSSELESYVTEHVTNLVETKGLSPQTPQRGRTGEGEFIFAHPGSSARQFERSVDRIAEPKTPADIENLLLRGTGQLDRGNTALAVAWFEQASKAGPGFGEVKTRADTLFRGWARSLTTPTATRDFKWKAIRSSRVIGPDVASAILWPDQRVRFSAQRGIEVAPLGGALPSGAYIYDAQLGVALARTDADTFLEAWSIEPELRRRWRVPNQVLDDLPQGQPRSSRTVHFGIDQQGTSALLVDAERGRIVVHDMERGTVRHDVTLDQEVLDVAVAGELLLTGTKDGKVRALRLTQMPTRSERTTGRVAQPVTIARLPRAVAVLNASNDGRLVVAAGEGYVRVIDLQKLVKRDPSAVTAVDQAVSVVGAWFTNDGQNLLVADAQGSLTVYGLSPSVRLVDRHVLDGAITASGMAPRDDAVALVVGQALEVRAFPSLDRLTEPLSMGEPVAFIDLVDGAVIGWTKQGKAVLWTFPRLSPSSAPPAEAQLVVPLGAAGGIASVTAAGLFGARADGTPIRISTDLGSPVAVADASEDLAVVALVDGRVLAFDLSAGRAWPLNEAGPYVSTVAVQPSTRPAGRRIMWGDDAGRVSLYDVTGEKLLGSTKALRTRVMSVDFDPTGRWVSVGDAHGQLSVWTTANNERILQTNHLRAGLSLARTPNAPYSPVGSAFAPDGARLATYGHDGQVRIWSLPEGQEVVRVPVNGQIVSLRWLDDAASVIVSTHDGYIRRYDLGTRTAVRRFEVRVSAAGRTLSTMQYGRVLVVGGDDGRLWAFDSGTGAQLGLPFELGGIPKVVDCADDGSCRVAVGFDGLLTVPVLPSAPEDRVQESGVTLTAQGPRVTPALTLLNRESQPERSAHPTVVRIGGPRPSTPRPTTTAPAPVLTGRWRGVGYDVKARHGQDVLWDFALALNQAPDGRTVVGEFTWSRRDRKSGGKEEVTGAFDSRTSTLTLRTRALNESYGIAGSVNYRARVAPDGRIVHGEWTMSGNLWGVWQAEKIATRPTER